MRRKSVLVLCLALVGVLALVAAGCGGGGKKSAAATTTATETTAPATTAAATTTEAAATTEAATTEATTTSSLSGIASAKNCQDFANLGKKFSTAFSGSANGADLKKQADALQGVRRQGTVGHPRRLPGDRRVLLEDRRRGGQPQGRHDARRGDDREAPEAVDVDRPDEADPGLAAHLRLGAEELQGLAG